MEKQTLFGKTLDELKESVKLLGMPAFTAQQIADWMYKKGIQSFDEMTNLSKINREKLAEAFYLGVSAPESESISKDGTKKYLYKTQEGKFIEAAYIPEKTRATLCVSSQVGCKMGCEFCMTGRQKFFGNLTAAEIVNQLMSLPEREKITNIVYMGMGEPMDNLQNVLKSLEIITSSWGLAMSPRRINVSTIGVIPSMIEFLEKSECHLAISMHSPFDDERKTIMPVQNAYPISEIMSTLRTYNWRGQRRLSFEYIVFDGFNHSKAHADQIARLLNGLICRVNLIRFHKIPDSRLNSTNEANLELFKQQLEAKGITTTIRASRGQDIDAACGLLSTKKLVEK